MKEKVVDKIMYKIKKDNSNLDDIKLEEIRYGLYGLYTLITKSIVIIIFAIILKMFKNFIIFLLFYSIMRTTGFGVHAKSNIQCWIFSTILLLGIPYVFSLLTLSKNIVLIIWIICIVNTVIFAPADTDKRPIISKKRRLVFKLITCLICLLYLLLIIKYENIRNLIIAGMILESFLINPLGYILMGQKVRFKLNDIFN